MSGKELDRACIACYAEQTETFVAFDGDVDWLLAGLVALGIPHEEADATLRYVWMTEGGNYGLGLKAIVKTGKSRKLGPLPLGRHQFSYAVCIKCAEKANMPWGVRGATPTYVQPKYVVEGN